MSSSDCNSQRLRMVSRYRERQYQLAAQKHNETFRKYDYYQQTANYFERECRIAKHYDSWNYKTIDPKGELQKAKKAERLLARRNKLRFLLKEEDDAYKREIEEKAKPKIRPEEPSLEALKQKLKEKRAEQSLYLPRTCRRLQSYFVCPKDPADSRWSTLKDTNLQYSRVCKDSTNIHSQSERTCRSRSSRMSEENSKSSKEQENQETRQEMSSRPSSHYMDDQGWPNPKFSARYARKSLENTNVRIEDAEEHQEPNRTPSRSSFSVSSPTGRRVFENDETPVRGDNKENEMEARRLSIREETVRAGSRSPGSTDDRPVRTKDFNQHGEDEVSRVEKSLVEGSKEEEDEAQRERDEVDRYNTKEVQDLKDVKRKGNRQFEVEKSMPWLRMDPGDKNLSKQMFLYLTHKELKCKIEDLAKRELHACNKQYWDEALRLRDMRNRLELIREKELYNTAHLDVDEEVKKMGLMNIHKRETELSERENICMDSTMYSEDAKAMWKKWVHEDDRSAIKDARQQRETMMNSLEEEWQNLAIRDKERISRSYQNVMEDSALQEEHRLSAAINSARMKTFPSSLK